MRDLMSWCSGAGYKKYMLYTELYFSQHGQDGKNGERTKKDELQPEMSYKVTENCFLLAAELSYNTSAFHQSSDPVSFA